MRAVYAFLSPKPFYFSSFRGLRTGNIHVKLGPSDSSDMDEAYKDDQNYTYGKDSYKPPKHTESFLEHLKEVKRSWPSDQTSESNENGVFCTGEPSVDPSRQIQAILDGESDWI